MAMPLLKTLQIADFLGVEFETRPHKNLLAKCGVKPAATVGSTTFYAPADILASKARIIKKLGVKEKPPLPLGLPEVVTPAFLSSSQAERVFTMLTKVLEALQTQQEMLSTLSAKTLGLPGDANPAAITRIPRPRQLKDGPVAGDYDLIRSLMKLNSEGVVMRKDMHTPRMLEDDKYFCQAVMATAYAVYGAGKYGTVRLKETVNGVVRITGMRFKKTPAEEAQHTISHPPPPKTIELPRSPYAIGNRIPKEDLNRLAAELADDED